MKPTLHVMVGLPRSGKSTKARSMGYPIVNPDAIRVALHGQPFIASAEPMIWAVAKLMVSALFLTGHQNVVLDATNTTRHRRQEWISDKWEIKFVEVKTSQAECIRRAKATNQEYLIPVIKKMAKEYEPL